MGLRGEGAPHTLFPAPFKVHNMGLFFHLPPHPYPFHPVLASASPDTEPLASQPSTPIFTPPPLFSFGLCGGLWG